MDKDDLLGELESCEIELKNLADAFEWISMSITCQTCGLHTDKWVDWETA